LPRRGSVTYAESGMCIGGSEKYPYREKYEKKDKPNTKKHEDDIV